MTPSCLSIDRRRSQHCTSRSTFIQARPYRPKKRNPEAPIIGCLWKAEVGIRLQFASCTSHRALAPRSASSLCSAFLLTTVAKRNVDLHPAAIRSGRTTVITVRKCHASLGLPDRTEHEYFTGLMGIGPCQGERYCLGLGRKQKRRFARA